METKGERAIRLFWKRTRVQPGCWEWTGTKRCHPTHPYGQIHVGGGKYVGAHRFSWELHHGPIPDGMHVCHQCDNPICVNPGHLFVGTHADNMRDMSEKGRVVAPSGETNHMSVLTEHQVEEIIQLRGKDGRKTVADRYGVSPGAVKGIWNGENWQHVDRPDGWSEQRPTGLAYGERHGLSKLDWDAVTEIRKDDGRTSKSALGRRYGVHASTIRNVLRGVTWPESARPVKGDDND